MLDYWLWDFVDCMRHEEEKGCSGREVLSQGWRIGRCFLMTTRRIGLLYRRAFLFITGRPHKTEKSDSAQMFFVLE